MYHSQEFFLKVPLMIETKRVCLQKISNVIKKTIGAINTLFI